MSNETGYQGWKNYETWAVALWIDNDEGSYHEARRMAHSYAQTDTPRYDLSHALKAWLEESMPDLGGTLWSDLLSAALSEVDWYEIADAYLDEVKPQEAEEEEEEEPAKS